MMSNTNKKLRILSILGITLTLIGYIFLLFQTFQLINKRDEIISRNYKLLSDIKNLEDQKIKKINELKELQYVIDSIRIIVSQSTDKNTREITEELIKDLPERFSKQFVITSKEKSNLALAKKFEKEGFDYLLDKKIDLAIASFIQSENSFNGYHQVYEIANYLKKVRSNLLKPNSDQWKATYKVILRDFSWKIPEEAEKKLLEALEK